MSGEVYKTRDVFVAGGTPRVTYNPRNDLQLEDEVRSYLEQPGKALSVSGPTKSGKTVLVERFLGRRDAIWMHGSDLTSANSFWERIVDWMGLYDSLEITSQKSAQGGDTISGSVGIPNIVSIGGTIGVTDMTTGTLKRGRKRAYSDVAREGLNTLAVPIVVDDFHYVRDTVKADVARAIKSLLPVTPIVMIAVPHEAMEAVRSEPDMTGRVWNLALTHWTQDELEYIATVGFKALNVADPGNVLTQQLAAVSYGAPFLMQQLCFELVTANNVLETASRPVTLVTPGGDWNAFLERIANRLKPDVFDKLLRGPKSRGQERIERKFYDGVRTDIYGAVLRALSMTGPKTTASYQELSKVLNLKLNDPVPQTQQITNALYHMSLIAETSRQSGDAALAYKNDVLHLLDPFLAFYLGWSGWVDKL